MTAGERRGGALGVLLLCGAFHGGAISDEFVYDDSWTIVQNPIIRSPGNLKRLFDPALAAAGVADAGRPTLLASEMLDYQLWGLRPAGFHLQNLLLHTATALLVFWGASRLVASADFLSAFLAGALFAVHPLLVEPVHAINYREDLLAAFFTLAALAALAPGRHEPPSTVRRCLAFGSSLIACFAKESAYMAPFLLVLLDVSLSTAPRAAVVRRRLFDWGILAAATGIAFAWRWAVMAAPAVVSRLAEIPPENRRALAALLAGCGNLVRGLGQIVVPVGLAAEYVDDPLSASSIAFGAASVLLLAALVHWSWRQRNRSPATAATILAGLAAYLPTLGLVPISNLRADRYLYLPAAFLLPALASLLVNASRRSRWLEATGPGGLPRSWLAAVAVCMALGMVSLARGRIWRSDLTLWTATTQTVPGSARAWTALAEAQLRRGRSAAALEAVNRSLDIDPNSGHTHELRGIIWLEQGATLQALGELETAMRLGVRDRAELLNNTGYCELRMGRIDSALTRFAQATTLSPLYDRPALNAARAHEQRGDFAAQLATLSDLVARIPESTDGQRALAAALAARR